MTKPRWTTNFLWGFLVSFPQDSIDDGPLVNLAKWSVEYLTGLVSKRTGVASLAKLNT